MSEHALYNLDALQLMSRDVVTVTEDMSLQAAAHVMCEAHVSGVPVLDGQGRCVGVLSTADFMHFVEHRQQVGAGGGFAPASDWQLFDASALPSDEEVGQYMSRNVVTVSPKTPLADLARRMLDAHIHRLIVVDANDKLLGVVSSTDILAAVAHAGRRTSGGSQ
jgi:CBS domain-containing protein